ncbi:uncharacterized protein LOC120282270 [Dioscorea cayenensis subsp. rotundata]|uniref:Uncharacterized protein LOC120282270 n=1 Tax=Dioscorea cayennensis subsp. rotundata TaxID=55577 RepID=A0AB40D1J4_DIOCR|nr:uncharacterized protein LOC120282270 [Dioscorea cayenensis subsp. rotundata]
MRISLAVSPIQHPLLSPRLHRSHSFSVFHNPLKLSLSSKFSVFSASCSPFRCFPEPRRSIASSQWRLNVFLSGEGVGGNVQREKLSYLNLDALLPVAEILCIVPPVICSIGCLVGLIIPGLSKLFQVSLGSRFFVFQCVLLAGAVVIGALIRERRWKRICRDDGLGVDVVARVEKVEEDLRSSARMIQVLSRQLEKLSIRFRVTRKALKEPISETAALAQKNSEATRVLAMQEDNLEKELGEIQKVLLAMQEQQQKQLELILAIGKAGKLLENKTETGRRQASTELGKSVPVEEIKHLGVQTGLGTSNDKA